MLLSFQGLPMNDEREDAARELRRVRDEVREEARREGEPTSLLPSPPEVRTTSPAPKEEPPPPEPAPKPPDAGGVNESWIAEPRVPRGIRGVLFRLLDRLLRPRWDAQREFNAQQVRLANDTLRHLEERSAATHRHYDQILGIYGRHLEEIDERHVILEKELVTHVDELVRRIDLVLAEAERGRLSLEHELRDLRRRLEELKGSSSGS